MPVMLEMKFILKLLKFNSYFNEKKKRAISLCWLSFFYFLFRLRLTKNKKTPIAPTKTTTDIISEMKTEILIAVITGSISLFGVIITAWLNYKAKLLELQMKSDKPLPKKKRKNTIWFIIFGVVLLGSGIYFLIQQNNTSNGDIIWETDTTGYFIDQRDQHKYKVVKIGEQIWMAENLNYTKTIPSYH